MQEQGSANDASHELIDISDCEASFARNTAIALIFGFIISFQGTTQTPYYTCQDNLILR